MTSILVDTQTVVWYLLDRTKLSPVVLEDLVAAEQTGRLFVSAITLVEIRLQSDAGKLPQEVWDRLRAAVANPKWHMTVLPVDAMVANALGQAAPPNCPDMSERIIAATAVVHELRLLSGTADVLGTDAC